MILNRQYVCYMNIGIAPPEGWNGVCPRLHYRLLTLCPAAYWPCAPRPTRPGAYWPCAPGPRCVLCARVFCVRVFCVRVFCVRVFCVRVFCPLLLRCCTNVWYVARMYTTLHPYTLYCTSVRDIAPMYAIMRQYALLYTSVRSNASM